MQGSFYGVISQAAFPDPATAQQPQGEAYMQLFPTVAGSVQNDEATSSSIIQLGGVSYPGTASISAIQGLPSLTGVAQSPTVSTIPLQSLQQIPPANFGTNGIARLGTLSNMSNLPSIWPTGICQGTPHTIPSLQSGISCYPYLPNSVFSGQFSNSPRTTLVGNRYSFPQSVSSDPSATDNEVTAKVDTHKRLSASDWRKIMDMHKEDTPIRTIMNMFGVSRSQVYRIIRLKGIKPNNRDENKRLGRPKGLSDEETATIRAMCKNKNKSLTRMLDELITSGALTRVISVSTLSRILRSSHVDD
ncbi:Hypothetical protein GL50581_2519 [Giardia duodenalis ATCC 50581]|nr:Hypothetical protein GL50581_2519 [Giardia intestinalis ATCC 50581]